MATSNSAKRDLDISDGELRTNGYFGFDVGGSLCKICFYEPKNDPAILKLIEYVTTSTKYGSTGERDPAMSLTTPEGRFHFIMFETRRMENAVSLVLNASLLEDIPVHKRRIAMTGGGAHKFAHFFEDKESLNLNVEKQDEMRCLVLGLSFLLKYTSDECFYYPLPRSPPGQYDDLNTPERKYVSIKHEAMYPYMVINIGTGVSFLKVNEDGSYERISGSGLGGGTYWGLARMLTQCKTFTESLSLSEHGKARNVDMTVGDIYGGDYASLSLPADMTASFFAKFTQRDQEHLRSNVTDADVCRGILLMVTNNIGQIAFLLAKLHKIKHLIFSGSFLRHSHNVHIASLALARAIGFWSNDEMRALFLRHEGYCGALGAFLGNAKV